MANTQVSSARGIRLVRTARHPSLALVALLLLAWSGAPPTQAAPGTDQRDAVQQLRAEGDAVLVGAGDIAECKGSFDSATAALVNATPGTVFTLGDNAYPDGTTADFANCYGPTWGVFKDRTRPVAGNHDYNTPGAAAYFAYFGAAAGNPSEGWYSYDVGTDWHVVVLNSNCAFVGGCGAGSPQEQWLRADLAASKRACTLAMWHHPRFSSTYGTTPPASAASSRAFWKALYDDGAEVVLNAHEHVYERFAAQDASGAADPGNGIRQFTVGTGGEELSGFHKTDPDSQARDATTYGVLRLTLGRGTYTWSFLPIAGSTFTDSGTGSCTGGGLSPAAPPPPGTPPGAPVPVADQTCQGRVATQVGSKTTMVGTSGDDVIVSGRSRKVLARGGNDLVCITSSRAVAVAGGGGHDVVKGGRGDDAVAGNGGDDVLRGGGGRDLLVGGAGKDRLLGGGGRDSASGGAGRDRCTAERERTCER